MSFRRIDDLPPERELRISHDFAYADLAYDGYVPLDPAGAGSGIGRLLA